jgi:hypothetical protein
MAKLIRHLCAVWAVAVINMGLAQAFVLLPPPASGFTMNFDLLPTNQIPTIGFGNTTWNSLVQSAAAVWNQIGIGPEFDHRFFLVRNPTTPNAILGSR